MTASRKLRIIVLAACIGFIGVEVEGAGAVNNTGRVPGTYAIVARPGSIVTNGAKGSSSGVVVGVNDGILILAVHGNPPLRRDKSDTSGSYLELSIRSVRSNSLTL